MESGCYYCHGICRRQLDLIQCLGGSDVFNHGRRSVLCRGNSDSHMVFLNPAMEKRACLTCLGVLRGVFMQGK